jgi:hypothetical protein
MKNSRINKLRNADAKAEREINAYYRLLYGVQESGSFGTMDLLATGMPYKVLTCDAYMLYKYFRRLRQGLVLEDRMGKLPLPIA